MLAFPFGSFIFALPLFFSRSLGLFFILLGSPLLGKPVFVADSFPPFFFLCNFPSSPLFLGSTITFFTHRGNFFLFHGPSGLCLSRLDCPYRFLTFSSKTCTLLFCPNFQVPSFVALQTLCPFESTIPSPRRFCPSWPTLIPTSPYAEI